MTCNAVVSALTLDSGTIVKCPMKTKWAIDGYPVCSCCYNDPELVLRSIYERKTVSLTAAVQNCLSSQRLTPLKVVSMGSASSY
jgi:hypothetical protein